MPRGDKSKYTDKQKRRAEHIADSYTERGTSEKEAKRRAWATVNAESHGGEKPGGSGYGQPETHQASRRGGARAMAKRTTAQRSQAAKKAAGTRKRKAVQRSVAARRAATKRKTSRTAATGRTDGAQTRK
ncbi:MAG TPA: plasmid stabilization protein [Hyalangium sp.]|nr:plasmid stabilization protein [Hyalangium sp.]